MTKETVSYRVDVFVTNPADDTTQRLSGDMVLSSFAVPTPDPLTLGPDTLADGVEGDAYAAELVAAGGVGDYAYRVAGGALPAGLELDGATGRISGTPIAAGVGAVRFEVVDGRATSTARDYTMTIAAVTPPAVEVLRCVEYMGAFRMPNDIAAAVTFSYSGLAGRRRPDGTLAFFVGLSEGFMPGTLVEIADPGTYSHDWQTAPQATVLQWHEDICKGRRGTYMTAAERSRTLRDSEREVLRLPLDKRAILLDWIRRLKEKEPRDGELTWYEFSPGQAPIGGLMYDDTTAAIYWSYADLYNVSGRPDWALGATTLHPDGTMTAGGPWRFTGTDKDGYTRYGSWMSGLLARHPNGDLITGSTLQSGNVGSPWGPEAYTGGRVPAIADDPLVDRPLPRRLIRHYYMGGTIDQTGRANGPVVACRRKVHPALWEDPKGGTPLAINPAHYGGVSSWQQVDVITGVQWIEYQGKSALMFTGINAGSKSQDPTDPKAAHVWYSNVGVGALNCPSHNIPPPVSITGPVCTSLIPVVMSYSLADVDRIVRGDLDDYAADPVEYLDLADRFGVRIANPDTMAPGFNGGFFDRERGYQFVVAHRADNVTVWGSLSSLVHVFRLG